MAPLFCVPQCNEMEKASALGNQLLHRHSDITGDLPEQWWSEVPPLVHRNRRTPAIRVAVLNMRATLANRYEIVAFQQTANFRGFENRK